MTNATSLVTLNGAYGEGGGALLRAAVAMAALHQQPVFVSNIRSGTRYPGLDGEDLVVLFALASSTEAELEGAEVGSSTLRFTPTRRAKGLNGVLKGAGTETGRYPNALIVLGTLLPVLARTGTYSCISVEGETHGANAISYDGFANVTLQALKRMGIYAFPELARAAFGRDSAGEVLLDVEPSALNGLQWGDRGGLRGLHATVTTSHAPVSAGERGVLHLKRLAQSANLPIEIEMVSVAANGPGAFITVWAEYERGLGSGAATGSRGMRMEAVAQAAFEEVFDWMASNATVDPYLADQIILPLALAGEPSVISVSRLTSRLLTIIWVIKQFIPIHITVRGKENEPGVITIH